MPSAGSRTAGPGVLIVAGAGAELYGADRMLLATVAAAVDAGWEVVATLPDDGPLADELRRRGVRVVTLAVPVLRKSLLSAVGLPRLLLRTLRTLPAARRLLRETGAAALVVNTVTVPGWFAAARWAGVPTVAHVHEAEPAANALVQRALAAPLLLADAVIVNSRFSREVLLAAAPRLERRSSVVYNTVAGAPSTAPRAELAAPIRVLFVGRLSERKGPQVAVRAIALLRAGGTDVELDIVGDVFAGNEAFGRDLRASASAEGLKDAVRFHGFVADPGVLLSRTDVVVVPSTRAEPFGNTAVEAVLARRPVVVSALGGLPEAVEGIDTARVVQPDDPRALADAIMKIVEGWAEQIRLVDAGARVAQTRFSTANYQRGLLAAISTRSKGLR